MKILSQNRDAIFNTESNNIFAVDDIIFISEKVNIYEGKAAVLGQYKDAKDVLNQISHAFLDENVKIFVMPEGGKDEDK